MNQYNKSRTKFHSKKERLHYNQLLQRKLDGEVKYFLRKVPFDLGKYGKYICDFLIVWADDSVTFEDTKFTANPYHTTIRNMVKQLYDIEIRQV